MSGHTSLEPSLARSIIEQIELVLRQAEAAGRPLEMEPFRGSLFELFVMADGGDLLAESDKPTDQQPSKPSLDLSADALCRILAERWNLADATRESFTSQTRLPPEHLAKMRLLWSLMRMWMEWTYAWQRWPEFHQQAKSE